ncbi:MAG: hypothetical protein ACOC0J_02470, partial [Myxococcota bacterium]
WSTGAKQGSISAAGLTTGPVSGRLRAVAAGAENLLVWNTDEEAPAVVPHDWNQPAQGLALGKGRVIYLLHQGGKLQAANIDPPKRLWSTELSPAPHANVTPTIAAHGTWVTDWTSAVSGAERTTGVLYVAHGGLVSAIIIDVPGPAVGWPNLRGGPSRSGTRHQEIDID